MSFSAFFPSSFLEVFVFVPMLFSCLLSFLKLFSWVVEFVFLGFYVVLFARSLRLFLDFGNGSLMLHLFFLEFSSGPCYIGFLNG